MRPIRIAQIGVKHDHAGFKMKAFRRFPEVFEVMGIFEPDKDLMDLYGNDEAYAGISKLTEDQLFNIPGLQAAAIESDVADLDRFALKSIQAGMHIHMDKPAGSMEEYEEIMSLAESKKLVVQMAYMYRYNPAIQYCLNAVRSGMLGEIFEIDSQMSTHHPIEYRKKISVYQGGSMYIFGCHLIDLIVSILGEPQHVTPFLRKTLPEEADLYDNGLAVLEYPKATCTVRSSSVEINGYGRRQFVVCGTLGTIEIKPLENPTLITRSLASDITKKCSDCRQVLDIPVPPIPEHRYDSQVLDFARMIRGEIENPYSYEHDIIVHRTTLKASGMMKDSKK